MNSLLGKHQSGHDSIWKPLLCSGHKGSIYEKGAELLFPHCVSLCQTHTASQEWEKIAEKLDTPSSFGHSVLCLAAETANKRPSWAQQWQGVSMLHSHCDGDTNNWCQRGASAPLTAAARTPLNTDENWPVRWHSHRGDCNPPACKLTDSIAVIELEAAEHLVNISCMIKAVASYHDLKGFCKQKYTRFMIYLWEITQIQNLCSEWPELKHPYRHSLYSEAMSKSATVALVLQNILCLKSAPTSVTQNCNAFKVPQ